MRAVWSVSGAAGSLHAQVGIAPTGYGVGGSELDGPAPPLELELPKRPMPRVGAWADEEGCGGRWRASER